jgi:hypothetical protein
LPTVKRVETGFGARVSDDAQNKLQRALESAAVEFIQENGGGSGIRLRLEIVRKTLSQHEIATMQNTSMSLTKAREQRRSHQCLSCRTTQPRACSGAPRGDVPGTAER